MKLFFDYLPGKRVFARKARIGVGENVQIRRSVYNYIRCIIIQRPLWRFRDNPLNALAAYYLAALPSDELSWQLVSRLVSTDVDKRSSLSERLCVRSVNPLSPFH